MKLKKKIISGVIVILVIILIDQLTKFFIIGKNIDVISGIISFRYLENYGIAFGIGKSFKISIVFVNLLLIAIITILTIKLDTDRKAIYICSFMILGGAISNFIDRIFRGFVIDFFYIEFSHFPVFNIADIFIILGILLFTLYYIVSIIKLHFTM